MKYLSILVLVLFSTPGVTQTDSLKTSDPGIQEAPESLKKLVEEINGEKMSSLDEYSDLEIDGLLFDETKTKSGRDFYDYFYGIWEAPQDARNYSIFIQEKPYRLTTTMIEIKINETLVFQSFLQPRQDIIELLAEQAVLQTRRYLQNYEELIRQLEGEDRSGTGIF